MSGTRRAIILPVYSWNPYQRLLAAALREEGVEVTLVDSWSKRSPILGAWWSHGRPETVQLHWVHDFLGGGKGQPTRRNVRWFEWQLRTLRRLGVRIVWTAHNLRSHGGVDDPRELDAYRRLVAQSHAVIAHCEAARRALIETYDLDEHLAARIRVIEHGSYVTHYAVDCDASAARSALGLPQDGRVFAFVGSIRGYKGVGDLIDAFMRLHETGPRDRLLVCGRPGPRRASRDIEQRAAADSRIILRLERLPDANLSEVLRASDVVVLPFRDILTSGSAILAMSHGRPVVAPRLGCLPETIPPDAGILYDPDVPGALEAAMRSALKRDLAAIGARARELADELDWGSVARRTAELYAPARDGASRLPAVLRRSKG